MFDYEPVAPPRARRRAGDPSRADRRAGTADFSDGGGRDGGAVAAESDAPKRARTDGFLKRGHGLVYAGLFLFTAVLYFRPYEYLPLPHNLAFLLAVTMLALYVPAQLGLEGTLTVRTREVNLVLLLCLFGLLSIPLAVNPGEAWANFSGEFFKAAVVFVVIANAVRTGWRLHGLFLLTLAVSCVLSVAALRDFRAGNFAVEEYRVAGAIGGMFGNPNDMALHLVTAVPLALALLLAARGGAKKLVYGACALLFLGAIVVTFSRGGFLGLLGATAVLMWKAGRRHRFAVVLLMLAALGALLLLAPGSYSERLLSIVDFAKDPMGSASMRQQLFWRSVVVSLHNPVFGVGMGCFHFTSIREQETHNAFTQVSSEMGLPALVVYVLLIVTAYKSLRRVERETGGEKRRGRDYYLAIGLQASLVGYAVGSFFASVAYQWYLYYLVGYAVALSRIHAAKVEARGGQKAENERDDGRRTSVGLEGAANAAT